MDVVLWMVLVIAVVAVLATVVSRARQSESPAATYPDAPEPAAWEEWEDPPAADPDLADARDLDPDADRGLDVIPDGDRDRDPDRDPPAAESIRSTDPALAALDTTWLDAPGSGTHQAAAAVDAVPSASTPSGPHPGSALPAPDGSVPSSEYTIKANAGSKRYHEPDSPYYVRTRADLWFSSAADAEQAGFVSWNGRAAGGDRA